MSEPGSGNGVGNGAEREGARARARAQKPRPVSVSFPSGGAMTKPFEGSLPEFEVIGVEAIPFAAAPTLEFTLRATEPAGGEVYTIALCSQIQIEPARRTYDDETRTRLSELFGTPERWAATTHSFMWGQVDMLVPSFTGSTEFKLQVRAATTSRSRRPATSTRCRTATSRSTSTSAARSSTRTLTAVCSSSRSLGSARRSSDAGLGLARHGREYYPHAAWLAVHAETLDRVLRLRAQRGMTSFDATISMLLDRFEAGEG